MPDTIGPLSSSENVESLNMELNVLKPRPPLDCVIARRKRAWKPCRSPKPEVVVQR